MAGERLHGRADEARGDLIRPYVRTFVFTVCYDCILHLFFQENGELVHGAFECSFSFYHNFPGTEEQPWIESMSKRLAGALRLPE